ncbi:MAG: hypothetical protein HY332_19015 [Chloroflexi bacterium]|nr:hypothetical protein [Chloroflexota bacterium]
MTTSENRECAEAEPRQTLDDVMCAKAEHLEAMWRSGVPWQEFTTSDRWVLTQGRRMLDERWGVFSARLMPVVVEMRRIVACREGTFGRIEEAEIAHYLKRIDKLGAALRGPRPYHAAWHGIQREIEIVREGIYQVRDRDALHAQLTRMWGSNE